MDFQNWWEVGDWPHGQVGDGRLVHKTGGDGRLRPCHNPIYVYV